MLKRKAKQNIFLNNEPALLNKKDRKSSPNSECKVFSDTIEKVGFMIGTQSDPNELDVDQSLFIRDLTKALTSGCDVTEFLDGLEKVLEDELRFKWCLMPTVTSPSCKTARNACQDSLIHLLLGIEPLQERITKILLEKLVEFSFSDSAEMFDPAEGKSLACMILSQFRWLSKVTNGLQLAEQLLEMIKATPTEVQRDIILLLPEVVAECDHSNVARSLSEILLDNLDLNVAILDTLSNLIVDPETVAEVRKQVLKTLSTANIEDLPGVVRFVLNNLTTGEIADTVNELRNNLDFTPSFDPLISSTPVVSGSHKESDKNTGCLVMSQVKLALKFQKSVCESWIKILSQIESPEVFKSFDVMILLVLHSLVMYQKKVESLIKNKIKSGDLTEQLLSVTFRCHHEAMKDYVPTLLSLSEILLRCVEPVISEYGHSLYVKCFAWFDAYTKQEIVGNLVTHIGNGSFIEINAALATLLSLVKRHPSKMVNFSLFIKNLLEYLDDLTLPQIRQVYEMLSLLSYQGSREGCALEDDMHIIIRKQLTNANIRYRKMGVIGALMAANTACQKSKLESDSPQLILGSQLSQRNQGAIALLDLVKKSIIHSPEALGLFYDEFCRKMAEGKLDNAISEWIDADLLGDFEPKYIISVKSDMNEQISKGAGLKFALDDDMEDPIALNLHGVMKNTIQDRSRGRNIMGSIDNLNISENDASATEDVNSIVPLLLKYSRSSSAAGPSGSKPTQTYAVTLAPTFRLLRFRKQSQEGCLRDIDALLGCPILLPELQPKKFSSCTIAEKRFILEALFHTINWFRENLNAFTVTIDEGFKTNVVLRLQLLIELQELACKYIQSFSSYKPPLVNFDCEITDSPPLKTSASKANLPKKSSKTKKTQNTQPSQCNPTQATQVPASAERSDSNNESFESNDGSMPSVMNALQPYFRELDLNVFSLFELGITFRKPCDIYSDERERDAALHPKELQFLLSDLFSKLSHRLTSSFRSRFRSSQQQSGFSNLNLRPHKEIVTFCVCHAPALCHMLEKCARYFRNIIAESDGVEDSLVAMSEDSQLKFTCMKLAFNVLQIIFSWKGFEGGENLVLLKQGIRALSVRGESLVEHASLQELVAHAVDYLAKFDDAVISLSCAAAHVKLLEAVIAHSKEDQVRNQIASIAEGYLTRQWFDLDKKRCKALDTNSSIQILLEVSLKHSDSGLNSLKKILVEAIPKLTDEDADCKMHTLNKSSLSLHYKIMLSFLVDTMKAYYSKKIVRPGDEEFEQWALAIKIFQELINLIKLFDSRSIIRVSLQYGRQFVDIFLKHGMQLMDKMFQMDSEGVILLLKELQKSTRYMHHVCSHSKVLKDVTLTRLVPFLKKTLESLIYRVKVMLAVNQCGEAFWLGNLKNRDLKGTEILSQALNENETQSNDSDSEQETLRRSCSEDEEAP